MADDVNLDLFEPFDRLLKIIVRGKSQEIPENNTILRGFQYVYGDAVVTGRFCWNNECGNCEVSCRMPGEDDARTLRGCQIIAEEGMEIYELGPDIAIFVK